eukprot:TRINITY_DN76046_c0_g1_i1.p1 TRINITY_DN76046_c0_g1~~TRINITY_DN76046_c0_g1_i1.p1  ORF type:complete len:202 (+),score=32.38 TRINITY_DN76046_c0_g1_i1:85-606(+)
MVLAQRPVIETSEADPNSGHSLARHQLLLCLCLATGLALFLGHSHDVKRHETARLEIPNEPAETELLRIDSDEDDVTAVAYQFNNEELHVANSVASGNNAESGPGLSRMGISMTQKTSISSDKSCPAPAASSKEENKYETEGVSMVTLFVAGVLTKLMGNLLSRQQILWVSAV